MDHNIFEYDLNEKQKVGFKCGTLAVAIACRESGSKSFKELMARVTCGSDLLAVLAFFYGCACQYSNSKKSPHPTMDNVSDWIETMGEDKAGEIVKDLLKVYIPKNLIALLEGASQEMKQ